MDYSVKTLLEICELIVDCEHKTAPTQDTGYPSIRTPNIGRGRLILDRVNRVSEETYLAWSRRAIPQTDDLILAREAPLGNVAIIPDKLKVCLGQRTVLIRPDKKFVHPMFLVYYMLGDEIQSRLRSLSTGVTVPHLNMKDIRNLILPNLPPIQTQQKIAAILSTYDDLIENNTRRIKILEDMAQTLYREWFVHFRFPGHENIPMVESELGQIPQGWKVGKYMDIVENIRDSLKSGSHLHHLRYVPIDCLPRRSITLNRYKPYTEAKSSLIAFEKNDILFGAMRSYFHKIILAPFNGITRTTCFVLRSINPNFYPFVLFTTFQDSTVEYSSNHSAGSTIPYATWDNGLSSMPIIIPPNSIINDFCDIVKSKLETIQVVSSKNNNLNRTRDLLLPKLISGQIDVSNMDIDTQRLQDKSSES